MSGELELRAEAEFASLPYEIKQAALEYARGCQQPREVQPVEQLDAEPQFLLAGIQQDGRSILLLSTSVEATKFARKVTGVDRVEVAPGRFARLPRISILVGAQMHSFEQIIADNYLAALQTLMAEWSRKAIS